MSNLPQLSEHAIQSYFVSEVRFKYRFRDDFLPALFYAVPSGFVGGGKNKFALIAKLKDEGYRNGIADLMYDQPRGGYTKLVIEFKTAKRRNTKNGGLSDEQIEYLAAIAPYACVSVCYTVDEAIVVFDKYMELEPTGCSAADGMIEENEKLKGILEGYKDE